MSEPATPRRYRAVFFELFGTLASGSTDDESHMRLMESLVERYSLEAEPSVLLKGFDGHLRGSRDGARTGWIHHRELALSAFSAMAAEMGLRTGAGDRDWFGEEYLRAHQSFVRLLPGAREMLGELSRSGLHVGIIEDCDTRYLDRILCWLDMIPFIDSRITPEDVVTGAVDPNIYRVALKKAGCEPRQAVFAGGLKDGAIGRAKDIGMTTVLLDSQMTEGELEMVDFVASSPARLVKIMLELAYTA
jgi:FMN phosphatase YigB (HAD superfamily)